MTTAPAASSALGAVITSHNMEVVRAVAAGVLPAVSYLSRSRGVAWMFVLFGALDSAARRSRQTHGRG